MAQKIPSKLYKYQPYNIQTLDNLKNRQIWFSKPENFNDPFDCAIPSIQILRKLNNDELGALYEFFKGKIPELDGIGSGFLKNGIPNEKFTYTLIESGKVMLKRQVEKYRQMGVACFTNNKDHILMWAHYTDKHQGICIEFDTTDELLQKAFDVSYKQSYPQINPVDALVKHLPVISKALFGTKSDHWCYEEEWRVLSSRGDQAYPLEPSTITGVYFGCAMPSEHKETIAKVLAKTPAHLYEMKKSDTEFKLIIEDYKHPQRTNKINSAF